MILRGLVLPVAALALLLSPCLATCAEWKMPERDENVDLLLESGQVFGGVLLEMTPDEILVRPYGFVPGEKSIPRSDVVGIRRRGESIFHTLSGVPISADESGRRLPNTIRVRVYNKLPLMSVAIIGGVFAGHRFGEASSEHELADELEKIGEIRSAEKLRDKAKTHEAHAFVGMAIGALALVYASIPTIEETALPVTASHSADLSSFRVGFDLTRLLGGRTAASRSLKTTESQQ
jgi:hypothetical protein